MDKQAGQDSIIFTHNSRKRRQRISEIYYMRVQNRSVKVKTKDEEYMIYARLDELEKMLRDHGFIRVHRSCIVNKEQVCSFDREHVIMYNKDLVPVGQTYYANLKKIFDGIPSYTFEQVSGRQF